LGIDPTELPFEEVIRISEESSRRKNPRLNPETDFKPEDPSEPMDEDTVIAMAPIEGTDFLIGPHVPTILND
jgi:hypothetical protein